LKKKQKKGILSFDITRNADFLDGEGFVMSENYLKKTIFKIIKEFCAKEKIAACCSFMAHGYISGESYFAAIGAFITSDKISCSWTTEPEFPREKIEEIMDKEDCDEYEAREFLDPEEFYSDRCYTIADNIGDLFYDNFKHWKLECLIDNVKDYFDIEYDDAFNFIKERGDLSAFMKEYNKISIVFDEFPWDNLICH
ncbi:hypothetical protein, partial [uncultured Succinivibrio sp.]|uniref:hypothetical protein n=1 Tax=uncultured Succinivibrio sp. TaxID=540749 RepID=UPI0025EE7CFA